MIKAFMRDSELTKDDCLDIAYVVLVEALYARSDGVLEREARSPSNIFRLVGHLRENEGKIFGIVGDSREGFHALQSSATTQPSSQCPLKHRDYQNSPTR